jgi:hypothetical protein
MRAAIPRRPFIVWNIFFGKSPPLWTCADFTLCCSLKFSPIAVNIRLTLGTAKPTTPDGESPEFESDVAGLRARGRPARRPQTAGKSGYVLLAAVMLKRAAASAEFRERWTMQMVWRFPLNGAAAVFSWRGRVSLRVESRRLKKPSSSAQGNRDSDSRVPRDAIARHSIWETSTSSEYMKTLLKLPVLKI